MLAEQISVTMTPTSVRQLIATARSTDLENIPDKCTGIMWRIAKTSDKIVTLSDGKAGGKPASAVGAVILDPANEDLMATSLTQFSTGKSLVSVDSGTVLVYVVVTQKL
jgi:hypothetical protein